MQIWSMKLAGFVWADGEWLKIVEKRKDAN